jgi:hypothetical protein
MKISRGNRSTLRKPARVPLCPPQIPHDQTRARTPGRRGEKPATNRLSYGAACASVTERGNLRCAEMIMKLVAVSRDGASVGKLGRNVDRCYRIMLLFQLHFAVQDSQSQLSFNLSKLFPLNAYSPTALLTDYTCEDYVIISMQLCFSSHGFFIQSWTDT